MKGKGKHKNYHFTSASTINNSVVAETKRKTMNSFLDCDVHGWVPGERKRDSAMQLRVFGSLFRG